MATMAWQSNSASVAKPAALAVRRPVLTREKIEAFRDTLAVLTIQLIFRATLFLRRWNY